VKPKKPGNSGILEDKAMNQQERRAEVGLEPSESEREVQVTVDNVKHEVHRGDYLVSEFKRLVGVDPARELDEIVNGELKPLDDNAHIVIKGGEGFVSHVRTGGSA
jgi:hypothetical protein